MPNQNPRKSFPAWRLINGVKNASDGDLEASADSCEHWSWYFGGLVVFGLAAEVILGVLHPSYDSVWSRWGSTLANALVFIGVAGEVQFSRMGFRRDHEIKRRSDEKIAELIRQAAEAEARALEAQLALEKFKAPRILTTEQQAEFVARLKQFKGQEFDASVASGIPDGRIFWESLYRALTASGWSFVPPSTPGIVEPPAGVPFAPPPGITVHVSPSNTSNVGDAAEALVLALRLVDIDASTANEEFGDTTERPNMIAIVVGVKPT